MNLLPQPRLPVGILDLAFLIHYLDQGVDHGVEHLELVGNPQGLVGLFLRWQKIALLGELSDDEIAYHLGISIPQIPLQLLVDDLPDSVGQGDEGSSQVLTLADTDSSVLAPVVVLDRGPSFGRVHPSVRISNLPRTVLSM